MDRQVHSNRPGALALHNKAKTKQEPIHQAEPSRDTIITSYTTFISEESNKATITD